MIPRRAKQKVEQALARQAAVVLLGPRQTGKTTLAHEIARSRPSVYLDLERAADRARLADPELLLRYYPDQLIILDEVHRMPELFQELRGFIDEERRAGRRFGRLLLLGSAGIDLLQQSETLAGRVEYVELNPLDVLEIAPDAAARDRLWLRGGFPDSYLARSDEDSLALRENFIRTYLERDVQLFGPRVPAETLRRFWTMLAHNQGATLNASRLASALGVSAPTVSRYVDLLTDLLLARRLEPFHANVGKRLTRSPKIYARDSGLTHALLQTETYEQLLGRPVAGASWEGFVIENLLAACGGRAEASFYRTAAGAEIDLVLTYKSERIAVEIKRASAPKMSKGLRAALEDVAPDRAFLVYPGDARFPLAPNLEAIGLRELAQLLAGL